MEDESGDVDRSFTIVAGEIEAAFDPPTARPGSGAQFVIREVLGGDDVRIRSDQLSEEELAEFLQHDPVFELPANGQEMIEFEVPDGDWAPPGEYEFQVENRATGRTATAVFQLQRPETPTPTPCPTGTMEFSVHVEPEAVASDGDTFVPAADTGATEPETPVRGFPINGEDGPLAPIAIMLNLTMIGFLLSVVGSLYQLMEGR